MEAHFPPGKIIPQFRKNPLGGGGGVKAISKNGIHKQADLEEHPAEGNQSYQEINNKGPKPPLSQVCNFQEYSFQGLLTEEYITQKMLATMLDLY